MRDWRIIFAETQFWRAAIFYVIHIAGVVNGAMFGIVAYAAYDLTNLATARLKRDARLHGRPVGRSGQARLLSPRGESDSKRD